MADPAELETRLASLASRGVTIVDPRQTFIGPEVELERIMPGVVLHPGTRLHGAKTFLGPRVEIGAEGPAVVVDCALAEGAAIASGYAAGSVLLDGARLGANAHVRPASLLEEQASTAHCVGLKHTLLLSYVTLGSLINFCDCLMAGGSSRADHSEVGSGCIHFNFTPWGEQGDKATPSLIGDVVRGVFLREQRIFIGGISGVVGPASIGYGSIVAAGQIVRRNVQDGAFVLRGVREIERELQPNWIDRLQPRLRQNIAYIAQLFALRAWYREVRLARIADEHRRIVVAAAHDVLEQAIVERRKQLARFTEERGVACPSFAVGELPSCPWTLEPDDRPHLEWVRKLGTEQVAEGQAWLAAIVEQVSAAATTELRDSLDA